MQLNISIDLAATSRTSRGLNPVDMRILQTVLYYSKYRGLPKAKLPLTLFADGDGSGLIAQRNGLIDVNAANGTFRLTRLAHAFAEANPDLIDTPPSPAPVASPPYIALDHAGHSDLSAYRVYRDKRADHPSHGLRSSYALDAECIETLFPEIHDHEYLDIPANDLP